MRNGILPADGGSLVVRPDRRRAARVCAAVVVVCILLVATGCFVMVFRPGRDVLTWRMLSTIAVFATLISAAFVPAFIAFYRFERAKHWVVDAEGVEIHDPVYGVERATWRDIHEVQVREHGVTLVVLPQYRNRSICFVDPDVATGLAQLHLSMTRL